MDCEKSEKYKKAFESLPENLRPIFRQMVEEYAFQTHIAYGKGYVAYSVQAEMVRNGWAPPPGTIRSSGVK